MDRLAFERHAAPFGAAKEAAVLAALRLLRAALDRDAELVNAMRAATHSGEGCLAQLVLLLACCYLACCGLRACRCHSSSCPDHPHSPTYLPLNKQPHMRRWMLCCATTGTASPPCWTLCGTLTTRRYRRRRYASPPTCRVRLLGQRWLLGGLFCMAPDRSSFAPGTALTPSAPSSSAPPAERIPSLVPLLLNSPPTGAVPAVHRLQDGFAACLQASLFNLSASVLLEDDAMAAGGSGGAGEAGPGGSVLTFYFS